ncbi:DUF4352 domain-containing protein [Methanoregula sp.]|uniref:DUF4352 domain-containing protein n=1 Tax=Methanoregula sp. TaxID=2052170 RepID=UPI002C7C6666|nr:DUF4352 domain-containing protein [Methanoregula sp.]HVP97199.1 DUF4352 domain-containing protein [Methanoregula sp.]
MAVKRCPRCRTDNPAIYDHCMNCGAPLPAIPEPQGFRPYIAPVVVVAIVILVTVFILVPAIHYSMAGGQILSTAISGVTATPTPIPRYPLDQPARVGDLQLTVTDARPGINQFNSQRFYTVTVSIQNFNATDIYTLSATDFILTDASGTYYSPLGIQSKTTYDALPGTNRLADLVYIVPLNVTDMRLLYTFPVATAAPGLGRTEVAFVL